MTHPGFLRWFLACVLVLQTPARALSGPELTIRDMQDRRMRLAIESFHAKVQFFEDLAETTITVTFRNTAPRITEGEFAIPLPPGATISGYALDVNGKMRESTVVEKERARFAYESIKNRRIDPGLIEREEGNIYRTKIFPIPVDGTKSVRLSYCEIIDPTEGHLDYHLLLPQVKIDDCRIILVNLNGRPITMVNQGDLNLELQLPGLYRADAKGKILPPELVVRLDNPKDEFHFKYGPYSYSRKVPKTSPQTTPLRPDTSAFELVWDCSESRRGLDHSAGFDLLNHIFEKHPNLDVKLTLLRLTPEQGGTFKIRNGDWQALHKTLGEIFYDGGTDLAAFQPTLNPVLVFTDGQSHFSLLDKPWVKPVNLIDLSGKAHPYWKKQARQSGGGSLDLTQENPLTPSTKPVRKFEKIDAAPVAKNPGIQDPSIQKIITVLWAQEELRALESELLPNPKKIIAHCKEHHLVSDYTSLIVLDRYADYLAYRIPPPEPELRKRYDDDMARRSRPMTDQERINSVERSRQEWHERDFPWYETVVYSTSMRLAVWRKALRKTFEPSEIDPINLKKLLSWEKEFGLLLSEKKDFKTDEAFQGWVEKLVKIQERESELQKLTIGKITEDEEMAIAVNGLINKPGKMVVPSDLTLLKAIEKSGGISALGSAARVSIYRNAVKTTYNTLSKKFIDIPLKPGDLIVVEQRPSEDSFSRSDTDPFSAAPEPRPSPRADFRNDPIVVEDFSNPPFSEFFTTSSGGGDPDPFAGSFSSPNKGANPDEEAPAFTLPILDEAPTPIIDSIRKALEKENADPIAVYQKSRPGAHYPDEFYLKLGDLFLSRNEATLARRVLSNLIEGPTPNPAAYRKWAFLLVKHRDVEGALDLLDRISLHYPKDQVIALDRAWLAAKLKQPKVSEQHLQRAIRAVDLRNSRSKTLAEIAMVESRRATSTEPRSLDLRIVAATASGQNLQLAVTEPINTVAFFDGWTSTSPIGGRFSQATGLSEYALRKAVPGTYRLSYRSEEPQIIRLQIHRNWGRDNQTSDEQIIILPASDSRRHFLTYEYKWE